MIHKTKVPGNKYPITVSVKPGFFRLSVKITVEYNGTEFTDRWSIAKFLGMARKLPETFWVGTAKISIGDEVSRIMIEDLFQLEAERMRLDNFSR